MDCKGKHKNRICQTLSREICIFPRKRLIGCNLYAHSLMMTGGEAIAVVAMSFRNYDVSDNLRRVCLF